MFQLTHAVRRSPRRARLTAGIILLLLAACALVWIGRASAEKGQASGPAAVSKTVTTVTSKADAIDLTDAQCATETYLNMPNTGVTFRSGGNGSRSVIVLFQAQWGLNETSAEIRLLIDGVVQSGPTNVLTTADTDADPNSAFGTHGFNFVSDPLPPGQHFAFIQWKKTGSGLACVNNRSLIVLHK